LLAGQRRSWQVLATRLFSCQIPHKVKIEFADAFCQSHLFEEKLFREKALRSAAF
jgi:hypothetical protein